MALTDSVRRLGEVLHRLAPPFGPLTLPAPVPADQPLDDILAGYTEFLRLADGAVAGLAGEIQLWPAGEVRQWQWLTDTLPGGGDRWYAIGDVNQNPVYIERATGQVWWFADPTIVWHTDTDLRTFAKAADDLAGFLDHVVLGPGYAEVMAAEPDDPWLDALAAAG